MKTLIFIFTLLCSLTLVAQNGRRDVVYLKNGSVVRGYILLQDPERLVKLRTRDGNIWVFRMNEIDSIASPVRRSTPAANGYFNLTEMGVLAGNSANARNAPFSILNINSWKFANGLATGIGAGVELFNEAYLPVVADVRYYFRSQSNSPFVSLQGGYSIPLSETVTQNNYVVMRMASSMIYPGPNPVPEKVDLTPRGGWLLNPAIGFQTPAGDNLTLVFSAGYRLMRHRYGKHENYRIDADYNRLSLKVGLIFK